MAQRSAGRDGFRSWWTSNLELVALAAQARLTAGRALAGAARSPGARGPRRGRRGSAKQLVASACKHFA
eukprot:3786259-Pyramimonas_sp.AAC.1